MDFHSLLTSSHPTTFTCSLLLYLLVHQLQILSAILDFLSWPVSRTGCLHQEPVSHLALMRVVGQAHALRYCSFKHFWTWMKHHSAEHEIRHPSNLQRTWMTQHGSMRESFPWGQCLPKENWRWDRFGQRNSPLFCPLMGSFKASLLDIDSPEAFYILSGSSAGSPSVSLHSSSWNSSPHSNLSLSIASYPSSHPLHFLIFFYHFCYPGFAPSKQSVDI